MNEDVVRVPAVCSECGKKVRVKETAKRWKCPQCESINININYVPNAEELDDDWNNIPHEDAVHPALPDIESIHPVQTNSQETKYSSTAEMISNPGDTDALGWISFGLGLASLIMLFVVSWVGFIFAIASLALETASRKKVGKNIGATIGGFTAWITILLFIVFIVFSIVSALIIAGTVSNSSSFQNAYDELGR